MIWAAALVLSLLTIAAILWPLLRQRSSDASRGEGAMAIFKDQLAEIDRDLARGLIAQDEANAATAEVKKRMVSIAKSKDDAGGMRAGSVKSVAAVSLLIPLLALATYLQIGSPGAPSMPFAEREAERAEDQNIADLTQTLLKRLQSDPNGGETRGWVLLGQTLLRMGRFEPAANAFAEVQDRTDAPLIAFTGLAEALIGLENGAVTPAASDAIKRALTMDASDPAAIFYKSVELEQTGDAATAHDALVDRLKQADGPEAWMEIFIQRANVLGQGLNRPAVSLGDFMTFAPGPSQEDVQAASEMTEEDRMAFIRSMVQGLADRLEETPDDLDGWLRLARAYSVLGEREKSLEAYRAAESLAGQLDSDDPRRSVITEGLAQ